MNQGKPFPVSNGEAIAIRDIPVVDPDSFRSAVVDGVSAGARVASLFAHTEAGGSHRITAVMANDGAGAISVIAFAPGDSYESLTPDCPQAHLFEREIAEQYGIVPRNHPWLKPVRFHPLFGAAVSAGAGRTIGDAAFFRIHGEEIHEVAVGPVHAGVIEPGHFRFQCHGEDVLHLEISLGYQHRGVEPALIGGPDATTLHQIETLAGDTTAGHAIAYCQLIEGFAGGSAPAAAQAIRGIALELERCANHTGDLGALAGDVGYQPALSFCGRIRGDFLNMTAQLCGNRFGRSLIVPGGTGFGLDAQRCESLRKSIAVARDDFLNATVLLWNEPSVMARFESTGTVTADDCIALGLVGPAARACGCNRDIRQDYPEGIYRFHHIPVVTDSSGDVRARAYVRWREVRQSLDFIEEMAGAVPEGPVDRPVSGLKPDSLVVSLVEGWRGEICHVAMTDDRGKFLRYKVVDPSFHNWTGLAMALRGQPISDFPLCNKSFNLSYCGHDL